jgi:hypothetical protein
MKKECTSTRSCVLDQLYIEIPLLDLVNVLVRVTRSGAKTVEAALAILDHAEVRLSTLSHGRDRCVEPESPV